MTVLADQKIAGSIRPWCAFLKLRERRSCRFIRRSSRSFSTDRATKDRRGLAAASGRFLASALGLLPWRRSRHTKSPFARGRSGTFEFRGGPSEKHAECRSPRSETTRLSSFSLFYDGRSRMALTRYRNCFRNSRLWAACLTNRSISDKKRPFVSSKRRRISKLKRYNSTIKKRGNCLTLWDIYSETVKIIKVY